MRNFMEISYRPNTIKNIPKIAPSQSLFYFNIFYIGFWNHHRNFIEISLFNLFIFSLLSFPQIDNSGTQEKPPKSSHNTTNYSPFIRLGCAPNLLTISSTIITCLCTCLITWISFISRNFTEISTIKIFFIII